jgi:hypothetical protein
MGLARQAAQRALGSPEPLEKGAALEALLMALARHELEEGRPVEAVRWLVGVW